VSADNTSAQKNAGLLAWQHAQIVPELLDDDQGAALYGVSLRKFLELQHEAWFPKPVILGARLKRHIRRELIAATSMMPRQEQVPAEPATLRRARIDRLKATGVSA
jgi:predicted DNA-binding transcriptional regulator AlpA